MKPWLLKVWHHSHRERPSRGQAEGGPDEALYDGGPEVLLQVSFFTLSFLTHSTADGGSLTLERPAGRSSRFCICFFISIYKQRQGSLSNSDSASIGERRNSTKPTPHVINLNVLPKPVASALNLKPKTQSSPAATSKASEVSQSPSAKPAGSNEAQKASNDKPPSSSTITVIISEGCIQKEPQKDVADATKVQQVELNIKPGSPLMMKHHINVDINTCSGTCEAEMEALKGRVELLEKEMTVLKKKFDDKKSKLTVETVAMRVSESDAVKQDTSAGKKTKVDKMILEKKVDDEKEPKKEKKAEPTAKPSTAKTAMVTSRDQDNETRDRNEGRVLLRDGKRLEQATRGEATVIKMESDKQSRSGVTVKASTKQESSEKLGTKQENLKDVPVNKNVTQSTEKKLNGSSKVLSSLAKGTKASANVTVKASSGKGKLPQSDVTHTENDKKAVTAGASARQTVEKHGNGTVSIEKDKVQLQGKKLTHGNETATLKEGTSAKKKVEKHLESNATLSKEGLSAKKKVGKQIDRASSTEKDKKPQQVNATVLREEASGKKIVEKHVNITTTIEKDRTQLQDSSTLPKVGKKKVDKQVNVMSSNEKDKNQHQASEEASGKKRVSTIIVSDDKSKKQLQANVTAGLGERTARKEKLEIHGSTTASRSKDKTSRQSSETTALKDVGDKTKKAVSGVEILVSTEKEKLSHVKETVPLKGVTSGRKKVEKHVNVSISTGNVSQVNATLLKEASGKKKTDATITLPSEKDKKQLQVEVMTSLRESTKTKVEGGVGVANADAKTTKLYFRSVEVHNITATSFVITWEAPQGAFRNFTVTRREVPAAGTDEDDAQEAEDKGTVAGNEAEIHGSNRTSKAHSGKADRKSTKKFSQVLSGTTRSFHFRNLQPQTRYLVSLYSSRPGGASKLQRLFVSTGPEPPSDLMFSNITETSLSVSWTKPKSIITGFRVTYTNTANGETGSMSVDSQLSHILISKLSAGSSYEISVRSLLETMESEPVTASVITVPDPPADLQAVNITDSKALLIWKPAGAKVDHYILSYGSAKSPNVTVTVMLSGSSVEHQLRDLHRFTLYTVKIISQINNLQSRSISTAFSTTSGVKLQAVTPSEVNFNSAVISWKSPRLAFRSFRLTYQRGEDVKEVTLNPAVTRYELTDLVAFSNYTVRVDGERDGQYVSVVSTAFSTAQVPYPFPTDCSQVQLNGVKESGEAEVYPEGKDGEPVWVYCDMDTEGGGWTVFQRRVDGSTDFFRGWRDYSKGFGLLTAEFWLGNDVLHSLTSLTPMSLRIDLRYGNDTAFAHYSNFTVGSEASHYAIALSGYSGTAGDSMRYHNGRPFSTKDKDPNPLSIHCAKAYMGGWWYKNCYKANLNGLYATFSENQGVVWIDWKGKDVSIPFTEMKLRPASLNL
ncbi:hypothetical protein MHYP_G00033710 [Metynnis hypsauchen]